MVARDLGFHCLSDEDPNHCLSDEDPNTLWKRVFSEANAHVRATVADWGFVGTPRALSFDQHLERDRLEQRRFISDSPDASSVRALHSYADGLGIIKEQYRKFLHDHHKVFLSPWILLSSRTSTSTRVVSGRVLEIP